ncbi:MAG: ABC-type amino acid transport substrate-binding protein [Oleispira sp.]|jgi:ABC-type amino acid transport substrate-binding protein
MNIKNSFFCLILLSFSGSSVTWADENNELVFHVIDTQPFGYVDDKGKTTGLHLDIIMALAKRSGVEIRPVIMPYNRIWATLKNGAHDGGIVWRSKERDDLVDYLSFVWTDYLTALTLKNNEILSYEDLQNGSPIGVMKSSSISDVFNNDKQINKIEIEKYENTVTMLAAKRVYAVVGNISAYIYIAKNQGVLDKLSLPGFYMGYREQWLQMSKKSRSLLALSENERKQVLGKLTVSMDEMVADGTIRRLNQKYYGDALNQVGDLLDNVKE